MQSYNFHSMRHLCVQVQRVGPLWNTSAFSYESAYHFLVKIVAGTVKSPEAIVEAFLKSKEVFMYDDTEPDFETLKNFSKVSTDCHNFCKIFPGPQDFFGRFFLLVLLKAERQCVKLRYSNKKWVFCTSGMLSFHWIYFVCNCPCIPECQNI